MDKRNQRVGIRAHWVLIGLAFGLVLVAGRGWAVEPAAVPQKSAVNQSRPAPDVSRNTVTVTTADGRTHRFKAELAVSDEEIRLGLMGRTALEGDAGMLFVFENARERSFWMHNTIISLDIIFIDEDGRIVKVYENARPMDDTPLPSMAPILAALEIGGGRAAALGIRAGDTVHHNLFGNALDGRDQTP